MLCALGLLAAVAVLTIHGAVTDGSRPTGASARPSATSGPSPSAGSASTLVDPTRVRLEQPGFVSWALLDRRTGGVVGAANLAERSDTMSMVKPWLVADYLTHTDPDPDAKTLAMLRTMIVDSDNAAATKVFGLNGGIVTIERMVSVCGLPDSAPNYRENRWSPTIVTARDTVLLGQCLASGRAAGPRWTGWLLKQMREVRGEGDFGARSAFGEPLRSAIAIKNGWFMRPEDQQWHLACLAIGDDWIVSVLQRYPRALGFTYGKRVCRQVAVQLGLPSLTSSR
ncbi:MAG: hypothetical protein HOV79_25490 [Hamadaea sp.]|nr:hypothetical protein [Hamadaea sp.]